jgi:hypothetical protein
MTDHKALKILFDTYWSNAGWKRPNSVSPEHFTIAKNAGLMFEPGQLSHAEVVAWLKSSCMAVDFETVRDAFLVSLRTRQLELRSALGSFAIAKNFPEHDYQGNGYCCTICGLTKNPQQAYDFCRLNFERYKWGGVMHESPEYAAFDLEQFAKLEKVQPTEQDFDRLQTIIDIARQCEPGDRARDLEKRLGNVLKSNKAEREILIQLLAYCGILQPDKRPDYFQSFPNYFERTIPPINKIDWTYPICWWRGTDGVNQRALSFYFPQLA